MRKVLAIGRINVVRFLRERANLFFVFLFPLLIVLLLGVAFGGGFNPTLGVHLEGKEGPLAAALINSLTAVEDLEVERFGDSGGLFDAVQRGRVQGGVVIPADYDAVLAAGGVVELPFVARPDQMGLLIGETVQAVVSSEGTPLRAARFAAEETGTPFDDSLGVARVVAAGARRVGVAFRESGDESLLEEFEGLGTFDLGAHQELVLFMFLTSLAGSAALIQTRRFGVARRMLATPTSTRTILVGETLGRFGVALIQGVYIMVGTLLLFGVDWGDPVGALALVAVFALVGAASGILMGTLFANDQQAGGVGVLAGLGLAALGGAMVPVEVFGDTMATIARATPHAWAIEGFAELVRRDGTVADILPQLGVLLLFAAVLMTVGARRLRRVLTR